jgi:hypothetical protein
MHPQPSSPHSGVQRPRATRPTKRPPHLVPITTNPDRDSSWPSSPSHTLSRWDASSPLPPFHGALKPLSLASRQRRPLQQTRELRPHVLRAEVQLRNAPGVPGNHALKVRILFHEGARVRMSKPGRNPDRIPSITRMNFSRPLRSRRKDAKTRSQGHPLLPPLRLCFPMN